MASGAPGCIVITGASRGLGAALARNYASPGAVLALSAFRRQDMLDVVAGDCAAKGARVLAQCFDAADPAKMREWIARVERERPIDLVYVNAGRFSGNRAGDAFEPVASALSQVSSNMSGAISTVDAVLPAMRQRRKGHVVLISSLAALQPLADAPAYSASKAGLAAYGEALREFLTPYDIRVSVVYPGNIETGQTRIHVGSLPLMMKPERAALIIRKYVERGRTSIAFPRRLLWLIRAGRVLPWRLRAMAGRSLRFHVEEDA